MTPPDIEAIIPILAADEGGSTGGKSTTKKKTSGKKTASSASRKKSTSSAKKKAKSSAKKTTSKKKTTAKKKTTSKTTAKKTTKKKTSTTSKTSAKAANKKKTSKPKKKAASGKKAAANKKSTAKQTTSQSKKSDSSSGNSYQKVKNAFLDEMAHSDENLPAVKEDTTPAPYDFDDKDREMDPAALSRGDMPMGIVDHLDEFRSRILIILGSIILLTVASFFFSEHILNFINKPFLETGQRLNIFKLAGGFILRLKSSVIVALMLAIPIIIWQLWRFIKPAIGKDDRRFAGWALFVSLFLFYGGMAFVFFLLLPFAIKMLLSFITTEMLSTIGASDYLSFIFLFSVAMGLLFELPIVVMILTRIGLITPQFLATKRKYAVVIIWVVGALITPADILSQIMVAIPLMFLYEISILISRVVYRRKRKKEEIAEAA